ncbi:hypothetical protein L1887_16555 [Cichorium endivia]|nr:hypothetical protein L1887_16555 [Cichorium endivia]
MPAAVQPISFKYPLYFFQSPFNADTEDGGSESGEELRQREEVGDEGNPRQKTRRKNKLSSHGGPLLVSGDVK